MSRNYVLKFVYKVHVHMLLASLSWRIAYNTPRGLIRGDTWFLVVKFAGFAIYLNACKANI